SLALSALIHHLMEKPLLTHTFGDNMKLVAALYGISISVILLNIPHRISTSYIDWRQSNNSTLREAMEWNHFATTERYWKQPPDCLSRDDEFRRMTKWNKEPRCRCLA
ncbi:hypothetical protein PFISCL1PPCAC_13209, partial [Pristionchus fissidentatus]